VGKDSIFTHRYLSAGVAAPGSGRQTHQAAGLKKDKIVKSLEQRHSGLDRESTST
jgi:hypothetical protein